MIYTKNIEKKAKEIEQKLNEQLGSKTHQIFKVDYTDSSLDNSDGIITIQCWWCLSIREINEIKNILGDTFYVTKGRNKNMLCIWTTYKIEGE